MNHIFHILLLFLSLTMSAQAEISRIEHRNNFYHIYNEKGREAKAVSDRIGTLVGHGSSFFIVRKNNFYMLHDEQGQDAFNIDRRYYRCVWHDLHRSHKERLRERI